MSRLMKFSAGLPRFAMDCGFWRTRRYVGASLAVVGLQSAAVSYCHEHSTDGWIPKDGLAVVLGFREREVAKLVPEMLRRGIWADVGDGFLIAGYLDHNPSRAEVVGHRARRTAAAQKANHQRWHQSESDPDCPLCSLSDSAADSDVVSDSDYDSESRTESQCREEKRREQSTSGSDPPTPTSPPGFDEFWSVYPNRAGKGAARKAWPKAVKAAGGFEPIVAGASRFAADPFREDAYTPHASTWLNAERWDDPPLPAKVDRNGRVTVPSNPDLPEWQR